MIYKFKKKAFLKFNINLADSTPDLDINYHVFYFDLFFESLLGF